MPERQGTKCNAMLFVSVCRAVPVCVCACLRVCVCAGSWQRFGPCWNFGHADRWARIIKRKSEQDTENAMQEQRERGKGVWRGRGKLLTKRMQGKLNIIGDTKKTTP